ncbi:MAG: BrnA antitoxin family protein [Pyrinomonadaceae bacterium]
MKKTENDYEYLETSPEAAKLGWKRISRPKFLDKIPKNVSPRDCKSRITIYLDADIVLHYKELAESSGAGYQTLINQSLRQIVDGQKQTESLDIKQEILQDKEFLQELKEALLIES